MSAIPPNSITSIIQTAGAAQRTGAALQAESGASQERAVGRFADQLTLAIQETDADTQVFADAEGQGGSGRDTHGESAEKPTISSPPTNDANANDHIDLTA